MVTSEAVLTELFHLVGEFAARWRRLGISVPEALALAAIEASELPHIRELMSRYWDRPTSTCRDLPGIGG